MVSIGMKPLVTAAVNTKTLSCTAGLIWNRTAGRYQNWNGVEVSFWGRKHSSVTIKKQFCQAENLCFTPQYCPVRPGQSSKHTSSLSGPGGRQPGSRMLKQQLRTSLPVLVNQLRLKPQEGEEDLQVGPPRGRPPGRQAYDREATYRETEF